MVSRIVKRSPVKSIRDCRRGHRRLRKSPVKASAADNSTPGAKSSSVLSSINKSFRSCRRRLFRIFSRLARITTPKNSPRLKGFHILKEVSDFDTDQPAAPSASPALCKTLCFDDVVKPCILPPSASPTRKTIFLDLDETLIHSKPDPPPANFDFVVQPVINGEKMNFYVLKRPGVDRFLQTISERFEIVVFTAGLKEYASLVLDRLDPKGNMISHRLYRDSCKEMEGGRYVKDLSLVGRDLKRVVIVDDNPNAYGLQPENAMPITPFTNNLRDCELGKLMKFFDGCEGFHDMREAVKLYAILEGGDYDNVMY